MADDKVTGAETKEGKKLVCEIIDEETVDGLRNVIMVCSEVPIEPDEEQSAEEESHKAPQTGGGEPSTEG